MPSHFNFEGNEYRPLLGENLDGAVPWSEDDRWWVRWPSRQLLSMRTATRTLLYAILKDYARVLFVAVPFALFTGRWRWPVLWTFVLNYLALLALDAMFISTAESLWLFSSQITANVLTEALPNVFPLLIGVVALLHNETYLIQSFIIGTLITDLLLGNGMSIFVGGLFHAVQITHGNAAQNVSSLTVVAIVPFVVPLMLFLSYSSYEDLATLTFPISAVSLGFYIMWVFFKYRTHNRLFDESDTSSLSPEDELHDVNPSMSGYEESTPTHSYAKYTVWIVVIAILAGQCSVNIIQSIPELVETTSLHRTFIGAVLLPIMTGLSNYIKTWKIARTNKMTLVLHLTVETAISKTFFVFPLLVIISALIGNTLSLNFGIFPTLLLFISVFSSALMIKSGHYTYLKGCMCLALYVWLVYFSRPGEDPKPS